MFKEKKEYSRSIRMTATVRAYVEKHPGKGFNQKFENMVLHTMQKEKELEKAIEEKEKRIAELDSQIIEKRTILERY